jgi:hypothetical protein
VGLELMKAGRLKQGLTKQWLAGIAAMALPALAWAQASTASARTAGPSRIFSNCCLKRPAFISSSPT